MNPVHGRTGVDCGGTAPHQRRLRVVITTGGPHTGWERLCPGARPQWGACDFLIDPPPGTSCDYWIVFAASRPRDVMHCAPENTLFAAGEPPSKKIYPRRYYAQFHRVVSTFPAPHPRVTVTALPLGWRVGRIVDGGRRTLYGYDALKAMPRGPKENRISVVCSNLRTTEGQRRRLELLAFLKRKLGDVLVHFGRGFTPVADKMDAILPYRFHLVLENSRSPHYWTERLADAYLGWAHPFYVGCPNISDYFPRAGFTAIDPDDPEGVARTIRSRLESPESPDDVEALGVCRDRVLETYNQFALFARWAETWCRPDAPGQPVTIRSHRAFRPFPLGILYRMREALRTVRPLREAA